MSTTYYDVFSAGASEPAETKTSKTSAINRANALAAECENGDRPTDFEVRTRGGKLIYATANARAEGREFTLDAPEQRDAHAAGGSDPNPEKAAEGGSQHVVLTRVGASMRRVIRDHDASEIPADAWEPVPGRPAQVAITDLRAFTEGVAKTLATELADERASKKASGERFTLDDRFTLRRLWLKLTKAVAEAGRREEVADLYETVEGRRWK